MRLLLLGLALLSLSSLAAAQTPTIDSALAARAAVHRPFSMRMTGDGACQVKVGDSTYVGHEGAMGRDRAGATVAVCSIGTGRDSAMVMLTVLPRSADDFDGDLESRVIVPDSSLRIAFGAQMGVPISPLSIAGTSWGMIGFLMHGMLTPCLATESGTVHVKGKSELVATAVLGRPSEQMGMFWVAVTLRGKMPSEAELDQMEKDFRLPAVCGYRAAELGLPEH